MQYKQFIDFSNKKIKIDLKTDDKDKNNASKEVEANKQECEKKGDVEKSARAADATKAD